MMLPKPPSCTGCPLWGDGKGFVPDEVREGAEVFLLFQNPGGDEEAGRRVVGYAGGEVVTQPHPPAPLLGKTGYETMRNYLPMTGLTRDEVSIGNVIRCRWIRDGRRTNDLPPAEILRGAVEHCEKAHLRIPGSTRLIVASGGLAWSRMAQGVGSITSWRGYLAPLNLNLGPVLGTLHVADLFRDPRMRLASKRDWGKVKRFLKGQWPKPAMSFVVDPGPVELEGAFRAYETSPYVVIDTEYVPETKEMLLLGMGCPDGYGIQVTPVGPMNAVGTRLAALVKKVPVVFQNAVADLPVLLKAFGLEYRDFAHLEDTMLAHAVLWSEWPHDLEFLASIYSPYAKRKHLFRTDPHAYNQGDVQDTIAVWEGLSAELAFDPSADRVYREQSLKLIPTIIYRREHGIRTDQARIIPTMAKYEEEMAQATVIAQAYAGWPINLASDAQLRAWLYMVEGLPIHLSKETRKPTINADAVASLRAGLTPVPDFEAEDRERLPLGEALERIEQGAHPLLEMRVVHSAHEQIVSHYLRPMQGHRYIYPNIAAHAQASGRWSFTSPPVQQFPGDVDALLVPRLGYPWFGWDWDQAELRILAAEANSAFLKDCFDKGWDLHTLTACDGFGIPYPPDRVDPHKSPECAEWRARAVWQGKEDPRRVFAKRLRYRLNYGGDPKRAGDIPGAKTLGLPGYKLVQASNRILAADPALAAWRARIAEEAQRLGVVRDFAGAPRRLLGTGKAITREAFDHPMQRGVSSMHNLVVARVAEAYPFEICAFVYSKHDALWFEVYETVWASVVDFLRGQALQAWTINGQQVVIPATFKERR